LPTPISLRDHRKSAYKFIIAQAMESSLHHAAAGSSGEARIPLEELEGLKLGLADPSPGLVENCRRLFGQNVEASTFDRILVNPFSTGIKSGR
jgi:hypothetical protein